jgi:TonB-linked SusC/RagA family outer membrane protein
MKLKLFILTFLFIPLSYLSAQVSTVTGKIISKEDGMPLPGASVLVVGTTNGTSTDIDGNYTIQNVSKNAKLAFSYIGFITQDIIVNSKAIINVTLISDAQVLNEVILTGYTKQRKVDMTGAITVVDLAPVEGQSLSSGNVMQAMQGRVAGLYIEKTGDPSGASNRILIRGVTTLGNNDPLYVIDGVPTVNQGVMASINPSAIESVQVLKDASASSLYGSRAANGVIIVTTKNSAKVSDIDKINVSYNSNVSFLSEKKQRYDMLNAVQRGEVIWQASVNDGADPTGGYGEIYNFDWNRDFNNPVLNSVTVKPFVGGDPNVPAGDTDWQKESYKTGYVINNEATISGGSDNSFHMLNLGYLKNTGILKYTDYSRISGKLNSNFKLYNKKIKIGINTQFSTSDQTLASTDVGNGPTPWLAVTMAPTIPLYTSSGDYAGPLGSGYSDRNNPVLMQYLNRWDNTEKTAIFGNVFGEWNITSNLTFRTSLGLDFSDYKRKDIEPKVNNGFVSRNNNRLILDTNKFSSLVFSNTLNYNVELGEHHIGVLLGTESIKNDFDSVIATADGFAVESESYFVINAATGSRTANGASTGSRLLSQFGKFNYGYSDKYLASVTVRRDGSSRFGSENRYGIFPAASVGWRINNEDFLKNIESISNLKLRAGYGKVGNQSIGDVARFGLYESRYGANQDQYVPDFFNRYYNVGTAYDLNGNNSGALPSGFVSAQAANPGLKWETTKELNLGVDFGLFNNAIIGSFDYFSRKTSDILTTPPIASAIGEGQQRVLNGASTETKGWELSLSYAKSLKNGLNFQVSSNLGAFKDKITELPKEVRAAFPGSAENSILGHSQFSIYGFKSDGLFQSQADVDASPAQVGARTGSLKFVDLNNDNVIDAADRYFIGNTLPDLEYSLRIDLDYKNFDLSVFGSGITGRIGQDGYTTYNNFARANENAGVGLLNAWTPTNSNSEIPALSLAFNDLRTSDYLIRNNSYFKIRNIQLGYSIPEEIISKWGGMSAFRVYCQGENLFWFTSKGYIGSDPERVEINRIPVPSIISLGLNVKF